MKKHELLEKAMHDYPNGVLTRFKSAPTVDHISNGKFRIFEDGQGIHVLGGDNGDCFYSCGEWAEIITNKPNALKASEAEKTLSFLVSETGIRMTVNSQTFVFTNYFLEKHLLPAVKAYKKLKKIKS